MLDPKAIQSNYLVYGLTDEQLLHVSELAVERDLSAGEVLCRQGESGGELYIVLEGQLSVETKEGGRLAEVGPNSVVGEMGLIDRRPRSASVVAISDGKVAAIQSNELKERMVEDGNLGFLILCNITRVLSDRLRTMDSRLDTLTSTAVKA